MNPDEAERSEEAPDSVEMSEAIDDTALGDMAPGEVMGDGESGEGDPFDDMAPGEAVGDGESGEGDPFDDMAPDEVMFGYGASGKGAIPDDTTAAVEAFDEAVEQPSSPPRPSRPSGAAVEAFDEAVEQLFDRLRGNPVADRMFYTASELGNFSILWHALAWAGATSKRRRRRALRVSAALAVESALVNGPIKSAFNRSRPLPEHGHPHRLRQPLTSSFPSGHASAAVVAAALLSESRRRRWPYWAAAWAVAASRVHVRIHHASDVVVGALVGAVIARLFKKIWPLR